jgi:elongation factor Ts
MAEITAAVVMKLRKMSGQGMMDCKKALAESNGDLEASMQLLRKKGLATMVKRAGRDTSEGRVVCRVSEDKKTAAMISVCCETDFASKNEHFVTLADKIADASLTCAGDEGAEALLEADVDGQKVSKAITDLVSMTGEKTEVGDFKRYSVDGCGIVANYTHFNDKVGVMIDIETSSDEVSSAVAGVGADIAMHVTAMNPVSLDPDSIDPEIIAKERAIATEQVQGKPENMIEKIVDGKMGRFFKENCLVSQVFVKDDSMTVGEALEKAAKGAGGTAKMKSFVRFEIG